MIRRLCRDDLAAFLAYRNDQVVGRFQGWSPMSEAEAAAFIEEMADAGNFQRGAWVQLAIARVEDDRLIGDIGLHLSDDGQCAEIGFTLTRAAHGNGYAARAVAASIELLFEVTPAAKVIGITDARNTASVKLLQRVGMNRVEVRDAVFKGEPCTEWVFARQR